MYDIGSEFNYIEKEVNVDFTAMFQGFDDVRFLRCGRDAIGYVCEDIKKKVDDTDAKFVALLPALCCDSMYKPFEVHDILVRYYRINDDLSVNTQSLQERIEETNSRYENYHIIVLTAIYYGTYDIAKINAYVKGIDKDITVIEDVTQGVLETKEFDKDNADYVIGSIRKWLGIPDGAVAIKNGTASKKADRYSFQIEPLCGENSFATERFEALRMKTDYLLNGDPLLKAKFRELLGHAEDTLDDGATIYEISNESSKYLSSVPLKNIISTRNNNYDTLFRLLEKSEYNNLYFKLFPKKLDKIPAFMLPVLIDTDRLNKDMNRKKAIDRNEFESILAKEGIYAPVLWPISDEAKESCEVSSYIADHILCFWIDQRYDRFDMVHTKETFEEVIRRMLKD